MRRKNLHVLWVHIPSLILTPDPLHQHTLTHPPQVLQAGTSLRAQHKQLIKEPDFYHIGVKYPDAHKGQVENLGEQRRLHSTDFIGEIS